MVVQSDRATDPAAIAVEYAYQFVDELVVNRVTQAVMCPGSRSTPLTMAFALHPAVRLWRHVDERSAAYFALGMAKMLRAPTALVCTSGTAAANFYPAIIEAQHSHDPLIVLTADRSPDLRGVGSLQTIDQIKLYGNHVKWFAEMPLPQPEEAARSYVRGMAREAVVTAVAEPPGPVHINFPFTEPLVPESSYALPQSVVSPPGHLPSPRKRVVDPDVVARLAREISSHPRGLIICGPQQDPAFPAAIASLAGSAGYPILADPLSQLRAGDHDRSMVIDNYDLLLRSGPAVAAAQPDVVLRFGMTPTSKPLLAYLQTYQQATQVSITTEGMPNDPLKVVTETIEADAAVLARELAAAISKPFPSDTWTDLWLGMSRRARVVTKAALTADGLSEPKVFEQLGTLVPAEAILFVGNSMPIRDLDGFFPSRSEPLRIVANRGVNGIDGVVSTALGAAAAARRRVVLAIGDLSFYHDLNGLLAAKLHAIDATIILLNNDGGGIFHFLPQANHADSLETYFVVPTGLDFCPGVEMYGGYMSRPTSADEFKRCLMDSYERHGLTVIEVRTDREQNAQLHRSIWDSVVDALDADLRDPSRA